MEAKIIQNLRKQGVKLTLENEQLIKDHFNSLPNRYAYQIQDAFSEVLMHVSLLAESHRKGGGISHCLRPVVAKLPGLQPCVEVTWSGSSPPDMNGGIVNNKKRMVSATPLEHSLLSADIDTHFSQNGGHNTAITDQDCFELTIAMKESASNLSKIMSAINECGLSVAETHGFRTIENYSLYWLVLEGWQMENLDALDGLLRARFGLLENLQNVKSGRNKKLFEPATTLPEVNKPEVENEGKPVCGLKRNKKGGSSFLNLWELDLGVGHLDMNDWEIEPEKLLVEEKIGQGAFGKIHKGKYLGETVAIKFIASDFSKQFDHIKEFMQEISLLSTVQHDSIVKFVGACTKSQNVCIVYEYMAHGSLKDYLKKNAGKTDLVKLLRFALSVAKGMKYLISRKIIHRDLKAQNILLSESGKVKIGDFGVARLLPREDECMTAETGTYRWMAPEVIDHKPYGMKADVYSFGILMWELMTYGKVPYELLSPVQAAVGVAKHNLRPKIPSSCPAHIAKIMQVCWETSPDERPLFGEIIGMLEKAINLEMSKADDKLTKKTGFKSMLSKLINA